MQHILFKVLSDMNVDEVVLDMKSRLPYTEATISEIQRLASVLPIAPPRLATKDVQVNSDKTKIMSFYLCFIGYSLLG